MGYYATEARMRSLFGAQTLAYMAGGDSDPDADPPIIDDEKLMAAIEAAEAEVNGYLQGVVSLPLGQVPQTIRLHACNIAYYYLDPDNPTEGAQARYKNATRFLERVQDGKAGLGLDDLDEPVDRDTGGVDTTGHDRIFTRDQLSGYD